MKRKMLEVLLRVGGVLFLILAFAGPTPAQRDCVQSPSDLVSWWDADAVSGTTAFDIQGGNDGIMYGDTTIAPGKVGNAFSFDGTGDYVDANMNSLKGSSAVTIAGWYYLSDGYLDWGGHLT